jgi:tetratricopeptide (TPR) repeat protein
MRLARGQFILALIVSAPWAAASGQVRILQTGRALDANPYVGGGGYNVAYPGSGFLDTQLYVDREVSGLAGFRGSVAYFPVNQINLPLPSDALNLFQMQSVGIGDVMRGQTYAPTPYYDPLKTVPGLRYIATGQITPGSAIPRPLPPATGLFGQAGSFVYTPLALTPVTGVATPGLRSAEGSFLRFGTGGLADSGRLFAVPDAARREQLARELNEVEMPAGLVVQSQVDARMEPSVAAERTRRIALPGLEAEANEPSAPARVTLEEPAYLRRQKPAAPDQDVFSDMLLQMQGGTMGRVAPLAPPAGTSEQPAPQAAPGSAAERIQAGQPQLRTYPVDFEPKEPALLPPRGTLVGYSSTGGFVLRGLAGGGHDDFNIVMTAAGQDLKGGKHYQAAEGYRRAAAMQPDNPLPRLGLSLALFGAGESLGSARQLRRAAEIFPPVLTSRVDLAALMDRDLIIRRLDFLAMRLETSPSGNEAMVYFIAAYVYANLGQEDQAKQYALKLQSSDTADTVLLNYARFVLTGQAASAPTSAGGVEPGPATRPTTGPDSRPQ